MSSASKFIRAFDSQNQSHVKWLARMIDVAEGMADPTRESTLISEVNKNPMKIELAPMEALEWPHIHFALCAVYSKAVLRGKAFIPETK
jgi:hypothetical protein